MGIIQDFKKAVVPDGDYVIEIVPGSAVESFDRTGESVRFEIEIVDEDRRGVRIPIRFLLRGNERTAGIAGRDCSVYTDEVIPLSCAQRMPEAAMSNLDIAVRKQVPTVPQALKALAAMEQQLTAAKTYEDLRRVIKEASALKVLMNEVAEVKAAAENAILLGYKRIAEELRMVPKAGGPGRGKRLPPQGKSLSGKAATGIKHSTRSRLGKLADKSDAEIRETADRLRELGKDATPTAVVRELTHGNKAERREQRERDLSAKILALPEKKYGVVLEDYEWDHQTWSERGKDRHASNHYSTSADAHTAEEIVARTKERFDCAADDCVLFMWVTSPFLDVAMDVLRLRGFTYKTTIMWDKVVDGTGYWFRNRHEQMLVGTRGNVPAPTPGTQWPSVIVEQKRGHSVKPEQSYQMIEQYFPNVPKIELNCRGKPRPGWDAWGNEVEEAAE